VEATLTPGAIDVRIVDDMSLVRRAEYAVDGGAWQVIHPSDGIADCSEERYSIVLPTLEGPSPHTVVVRGWDEQGNAAAARVEVP
jgi:hypothetical protein